MLHAWSVFPVQVEEAAEAMKENLDANRPHVKFSFLNQDDSGKTMLNILNPDTGTGMCVASSVWEGLWEWPKCRSL